LSHLRKVLAQYPKDRVVRNEAGRVLFLQRKYKEAVQQFEETLSIDPEDLPAHYNLMLSYKGLGDSDRAKQHEVRYLRFKADEAAQALTGPYRNLHPHDNNERQAIHEHVSVDLSQPKSATSLARKRDPKKNVEARIATSNHSGSTD
jgi:tetratricopeptide (TPR) repeat protein